MNSERRHFSPQEKIAILKRHLLEGTPVSTICDQLGIAPTLFYRWQKELFENGHSIFENGRKAKAVEDANVEKIQKLEAKLQRKNEVMAELMEAHTLLKKILGNSNRRLGPARHARRTRRFRSLLVGQNRHRRRAFYSLDRRRPQQVSGLGHAFRQSQRAQRLDATRSLAHPR
jgi:transposase